MPPLLFTDVFTTPSLLSKINLSPRVQSTSNASAVVMTPPSLRRILTHAPGDGLLTTASTSVNLYVSKDASLILNAPVAVVDVIAAVGGLPYPWEFDPSFS